MSSETPSTLAVRTENLNLWYGDFQALFNVCLDVKPGIITSMIGPSGCGKSTLLRCFNRINERHDYVRTEGIVEINGVDAYAPGVEFSALRRVVGQVFQRPNPLPISIRKNVLFAHNVHIKDKNITKSDKDDIVEQALRTVLL